MLVPQIDFYHKRFLFFLWLCIPPKKTKNEQGFIVERFPLKFPSVCAYNTVNTKPVKV